MSGYIDQQVGQYGDYRSSGIETKTQKPNYTQSSKSNVLNGYRSYTYNFTMAALSLAEANDPDSYQNKPLTRVILKTGGKGPNAIANDSELTSNFNERSPGRFDMFIDNFEIDSKMGFSNNSSVSLPTTISFDVIEPYSVSGFIEALQIAAVSAGYPSYASASFVLKMEFRGYPDTIPIEDSSAELIPESTRYFMFRITKVSVDITEQGTRYKCGAILWTHAGFGQSNILKKPIKIQGTTVAEILNNFMKSVTDQNIQSDKNSTPAGEKAWHDEYDIKFPSATPTGFDFTALNALSASNISDFSSNTVYAFNDISDSPIQDAYDGPTRNAGAGRGFVNPIPTVQFKNGAAIHECIAAIIRDSDYGSKIIKNVQDGTAGIVDEYGFFNYFLITIEVTNLLDIDAVKRKPRQKFTYVVTPYRMHYTIIPNYSAQNVDVSKLKNDICLREYNYIYMGKNVDVLTFKLNFNALYFEAASYAMGNNTRLREVETAQRDGVGAPKVAAWDANAVNKDNIYTAPPKLVVSSAGDINPAGGTGNAPQTDPYTILARNMHEAIINSGVGLATGEIEIIGDPFYLVTGGTGNYNPKLESMGKTVNGEVAYNHGEVFVTINFKNPIDISTFDEGGQMYFSEDNAQFSGVYKITTVISSFKGGTFIQRLSLIRVPGQISDNTVESKISEAVTSESNANATPVNDASAAIMPGLRATTRTLGLSLGGAISGLRIPTVSDFVGAAKQLLPPAIDLGIAKAQGVVLDLIPSANLTNLPAIAPYSIAPLPELPKFESVELAATTAVSGLKFNPLSKLAAQATTSQPLSTLYSLTSGKK